MPTKKKLQLICMKMGHKWSEYVITVVSTGYKYHFCLFCGLIEEIKDEKKENHLL